MINLKTFFNGFFLVVQTLNQGFAGNVINAFNLRRIEFNVIGTAGSDVHSAAAHTFKNDFIGNGDFDDVVDRDTGLNQSFGLRNCAREAVKEETVLAVRLF